MKYLLMIYGNREKWESVPAGAWPEAIARVRRQAASVPGSPGLSGVPGLPGSLGASAASAGGAACRWMACRLSCSACQTVLRLALAGRSPRMVPGGLA